ncbi:uncharacterized protein BDV14DRAFT_195385 [Aspergillus stella-maris]|uniref:uncharacterized protein n=1 Tax=Aspergillus stella-maris TaxID=1810926 RepID=UPI003CCD3944
MASTNKAKIVPCSWLFHGGKLYPYEFSRGEERLEPPAEFIDDLGAILAERGLSDLIGVQVYNEGFVSVENTDVEKRISATTLYPEDAKEVQGQPHPRAVMASFAFF